MSPDELGEGLSEAAGVLKAAGGTVRFLAMDTETQAEKEVRSVAEMRALLVGGGGTNFRSTFAELVRRPKHKRPSVVVIITDGYATVPSRPPIGVNVIWLIVGTFSKKPCDWGEFIDTNK